MLCLAFTLAVAAAIVFQSAQARGSPGVVSLTTNEAYAGHFAVYAVMTFAALMALGRRTLPAVLGVLALAAGLGLALEAYQAFVPSRAASGMDAVANASGAALGALLYLTMTAGAQRTLRGSNATGDRAGARNP